MQSSHFSNINEIVYMHHILLFQVIQAFQDLQHYQGVLAAPAFNNNDSIKAVKSMVKTSNLILQLPLVHEVQNHQLGQEYHDCPMVNNSFDTDGIYHGQSFYQAVQLLLSAYQPMLVYYTVLR